jgi:murein DD-endopeptidase MepM/ murein hydrolase activator NlpD
MRHRPKNQALFKSVMACIGGLCSHATLSDPCVSLQGDAVQGGLLWGQAPAATEIRFADQSVPILPGGYFIVGLGRDMLAVNTLLVAGEHTCQQEITVMQREYALQRVTGVPQKTVRPSEEQLAWTRAERARVRAAKSRRIERTDGFEGLRDGFSWPVTGPISGVYGSQRIYNGTPGAPHYGVDIARPVGTPVVAPAAGEVTLAEPDLFYSGGTVIIDHGYGLSSSFLHLSQVSVAVGDRVTAGDVLGAVGATGRATGPHLDWRMSWFNHRIDPQLLVPPMPD